MHGEYWQVLKESKGFIPKIRPRVRTVVNVGRRIAEAGKKNTWMNNGHA